MLRELRRAIQAEGQRVVKVEAQGNTHFCLTVMHGDAKQFVSVSCSPRDETYCINGALRQVRRFGKALHGKHPLEAKPSVEV